MFKVKARSEGKIKNCLAIRDMYKYYTSITAKEDWIDYKTFSLVTKECNKELINQVVNHSEIVTLPYRLGAIQISKYERNFDCKRKNKWTINYQKSKEAGVLLYHDTPYFYRWKWKKHNAIVINKTGYKFKANRNANRLITRALNNGRDYFK